MRTRVVQFCRILGVVVIFVAVLFIPRTRIGFLTVDGKGLSDRPFMVEGDVTFINTIEPWTALPVSVTYIGVTRHAIKCDILQVGLEETHPLYPYYTIVENGYQEGFEDLWCEVYDKINGKEEFSEINAIVLQEILEYVHGKECYGDLRDIMTDCLMFVKELNENGISTDSNHRASILYNRVYGWLCNFSIKNL